MHGTGLSAGTGRPHMLMCGAVFALRPLCLLERGTAGRPFGAAQARALAQGIPWTWRKKGCAQALYLHTKPQPAKNQRSQLGAAHIKCITDSTMQNAVLTLPGV